MEAMIQAGLSDISAHCVSPKGGPEWLHCHVPSTKSKETLPICLLSSAYTCFDRSGHALQEWPLICVAIYSKLSYGECSRLCLADGEHISSQWPCLCKAMWCSGFLRLQATARRNLHARRQAPRGWPPHQAEARFCWCQQWFQLTVMVQNGYEFRETKVKIVKFEHFPGHDSWCWAVTETATTFSCPPSVREADTFQSGQRCEPLLGGLQNWIYEGV